MVRAPEQASSERIPFALVIGRIEIVIRFGCLVDDANHAIIHCIFKTINFIPVRTIDHCLVKHDCLVPPLTRSGEGHAVSALPLKADILERSWNVRADKKKARSCDVRLTPNGGNYSFVISFM